MPILLSVDNIVSLPISNFWVLWWAALFFLIAYVLLRLSAPAFVQDYQYFSQFYDQKHSHRWIVWQFEKNLRIVPDVKYLLAETVRKEISFLASSKLPQNICRHDQQFPASAGNEVEVYAPNNVGRDIYLPFRMDNKKYILPMQEDDPALEQKQKELFWILLSALGSSRVVLRQAFWLLMAAALSLFAYSVSNNISRVAFGITIPELISKLC